MMACVLLRGLLDDKCTPDVTSVTLAATWPCVCNPEGPATVPVWN